MHRSIGVSCALLGSAAAFSGGPRNVLLEETPNDKKTDQVPFDLTKEWSRSNGSEFLKNLIVTDKCKPTKEQEPGMVNPLLDWVAQKLTPVDDEVIDSNNESFLSTIKGFTSLLVGTDESKGEALQNLIQRARSASNGDQQGDIRDSQSWNEILAVLRQDLDVVSKSLSGPMGQINLSQLFPTSLFYFLEKQDEQKNPSWKRRMHRFCPGINIDEVNYLNDALYLAELAYETTVDSIKAGLDDANDPLELVYCTIEGESCRPAHFVALKRNQSVWSSALEVVMVVRGTSSITDAITDAMCNPVDYRGGKAHAGILESGKYLAVTHVELLENLRRMSGKRKVKLTLVGHSLGAGAAAIAGMELKACQSNFDVKVIGFGCPALLSEDLSKAVSSYMTTVIGDSDLVPRMSGATIGNLLLDIQEYNYVPNARRDIEQAFDELEYVSPGILSKGFVDGLMHTVDSLFENIVDPTIKPATVERSVPVLFPPGRCVHFYRDGYGVTGSVTPCKLFSEIDLSRRMIDDHLITPGYRQIFLDLMRQYHNDQHFSFSEVRPGKN